MLYLLSFVMGMIFVILISPSLDILVSWINTLVAKKVYDIQCTMEETVEEEQEKQPMGFVTPAYIEETEDWEEENDEQ